MWRSLRHLGMPKYFQKSVSSVHRQFPRSLCDQIGPLRSMTLQKIERIHGNELRVRSFSTVQTGLLQVSLNNGLNFKKVFYRNLSLSAERSQESSTTHQPREPKQDGQERQTRKDITAGFKEVCRLFYLAKHDWKILLLAVTLLAISSSIGMAVPKIIGMVLDATKDAVSRNSSTESYVLLTLDDLPPIVGDIKLFDFLMLFGGALLIGTIANFGRSVLLKIAGESLVARLRSSVAKKIMHHDMEFFDTHKVGDILSRLGADAYIVSRSMTQNISDGFKAIICGGVGVGMMFHISSTLATVLFLFAPPLLIGATIYGNKIRSISRELQQASGNLTRVAEEQLSGIKTVQSFVAEGKEVNRYNSAIRDVFRVGRQEAFTSATFFSSTNVLGDISFLVVLAYGSHLVLQGGLSIGDLTAFMLYTEYTGSAVFGLSNFYSELMKGAGASTRLFELLDYKSSIKPSTGKKFIVDKGKIEFKDVSFAYPTRKANQIFKNLNFTIEPGSNVCIVGPSGRGKSTIASLLLRYYNPTSGTILVDGQDISKLNSKSLRRHLGVVQQEPVLLSGTIRENFQYGLDREASMDEIRSVAKKCFCHNFITKFPQGYETIIGPRGALLSGGQKQRIAIARALLKNPKILILDEATSALDVESEGAINYTLGKLMKSNDLTIISIAHRLSTIRRSENIIVVGMDGSISEVGKFNELYANKQSALYKLLNENSEHQAHHQTQFHLPLNESSDKSNASSEGVLKTDLHEKSIQDEVINQILEDITHDTKSSTFRH